MKINKKITSLILIAGITSSFVVGCGSYNVKYEETVASRESLKNANDKLGYPDISNFTEKKMLKEILELRDNPNLICYYYTKNTMTGKYVYQGRCVGFGIPYASSYTNPQDGTEALAEPNGLYNNGISTSATWIAHINDKNEREAKYMEEEITVSQSKIDENLCEKWSLPSNY